MPKTNPHFISAPEAGSPSLGVYNLEVPLRTPNFAKLFTTALSHRLLEWEHTLNIAYIFSGCNWSIVQPTRPDADIQ